MTIFTLYSSGSYENPLTEIGRGRTIAAFHVAQSSNELTDAETRRDILNFLMSPRAVGYWLNEKHWLEKGRKIGRVEILKLTPEGLRTCANSLNGGASVGTSRSIVDQWIRRMRNGDSISCIPKEFSSFE